MGRSSDRRRIASGSVDLKKRELNFHQMGLWLGASGFSSAPGACILVDHHPAPNGIRVRVDPQPLSTSSADRALFTRIVALPSSRRAMQDAQFPASHEN